MRKRHKNIRNGTVVLTVIMAVGMFTYSHKVKALTKDIEYKINVEKAELSEKEEQLANLQQELESMDSLEYVKKVATEQLKMVEKDTIVIKERE